MYILCPEDKHGSLFSGSLFLCLYHSPPPARLKYKWKQDIKRCRSKMIGEFGDCSDDLRKMICSKQQFEVFRVTSGEVARICRGCRNVQAQYTPCHCRYNLPIYLGDSFPSEAPPTNILNIPWINPTQQQSPAGKFMYFLGSTNIAGLENGPGLIESMYFIYRN